MSKAHSSKTAIDLFAGCGGTSLGLKLAGYRVLSAVEMNPYAADCYSQNHPEVQLFCNDIRELSCNDIWSSSTPPSIVAACPPCQGFSLIRSKNSSAAVRDPRNSLYLHFLRVVIGLRPASVLMENVPPFASGYRFRNLLNILRRAGYLIRFGIVDAADFGVAQRRKRLVLVGSRAGLPVWPDLNSGKLTLRDALSKLYSEVDLTVDALHNLPQRFGKCVVDRIRSVPPESTRKRAKSFEQLPCHSRNNGFHDVYGRMRMDEPAPTITTGVYSPSKGRFIHPTLDRCVSLREAATIQGFPANYHFPVSIGKMRLAEMIGNAAPPQLIRAFAESAVEPSREPESDQAHN